MVSDVGSVAESPSASTYLKCFFAQSEAYLTCDENPTSDKISKTALIIKFL